jgi:purine-binding chemotaxis protein CheW
MSTTGADQYVVFKLGKEEYGFEVSTVREIHTMEQITKVHRSAQYIEGVMNLRGRLLTVINLRKRFAMEPGEAGDAQRIIVVDASDSPVGFLVDQVAEVARISKESVEKAPAHVTKDIESAYVIGIAKHEDRLITLIDPVKVLELTVEDRKPAGGDSNG